VCVDEYYSMLGNITTETNFLPIKNTIILVLYDVVEEQMYQLQILNLYIVHNAYYVRHTYYNVHLY